MPHPLLHPFTPHFTFIRPPLSNFTGRAFAAVRADGEEVCLLTSERPLCGRLSLPESSLQREEGRPARARERREAAALLVLGLLVAAKVDTTQETRLVLTANGEFGVCFCFLFLNESHAAS